MNTEILKNRFDALKYERKTLEETWQWIENLVVPFRGKFFRDQTTEAEIIWNQQQLFDTTAVLACDILSAAMQGSLTSPTIKWFGINFLSEKLNADPEVREWAEICEDVVFETLQASNFNIEASEFYIDLCSFGTGIVSEEPVNEEMWEGVEFNAIPMRECFFEEGADGRIRRFYKLLQWKPGQVIDKFGKDNVPDWVIQKDGNANAASEKIDIVFVVYENQGEVGDITTVLPVRRRPFQYKYFFHKDASQIGETGGYYEMPAFIARWRKVSGSQWGHSPAMIALADIRNANELVESTLEAVGKVVDPATLTTQRGLLSDLDLGRGGLTVVRSLQDLAPFESAARFDVAAGTLQMFQSAINRVFRVDQLQLKESPAMTATEVQVRYELMQRLLGPTLGRLQNDFLNPLVSRTFNILNRAGRLPQLPEKVREAQGEISLEYTGPLPRAQRMEQVRATQEWLMTIGQMAEVFPSMLDSVDPDAVTRRIARLMSVPAAMLRTDEEVQQLRAERAEQEAAMAEAEIAQTEGAAMEAQGRGAQALNEAEQTAAAA
jgi:hypothetical protein